MDEVFPLIWYISHIKLSVCNVKCSSHKIGWTILAGGISPILNLSHPRSGTNDASQSDRPAKDSLLAGSTRVGVVHVVFGGAGSSTLSSCQTTGWLGGHGGCNHDGWATAKGAWVGRDRGCMYHVCKMRMSQGTFSFQLYMRTWHGCSSRHGGSSTGGSISSWTSWIGGIGQDILLSLGHGRWPINGEIEHFIW